MTNDVADTLISVQIRLENLGFVEVTRDDDLRRITRLKELRVLSWAIAVLERNGWATETIFAHLSRYPVEKNWWAIKQLLPDEALEVLDRKLAGLENETVLRSLKQSQGEEGRAI